MELEYEVHSSHRSIMILSDDLKMRCVSATEAADHGSDGMSRGCWRSV